MLLRAREPHGDGSARSGGRRRTSGSRGRGPGSASVPGGLYTVAGAGQISGSADSFRFLYQTLSGDGQIQARISSAQNTGTSRAHRCDYP